ncbi:2-isopropylmalate synthase [Maioricimonas rarisocia]|uniref:Citramalate synthase n=1 Tax=Maioricimonas rarisocia TaxID=2528026 RepID=A0A517Z2R1_9PLAN|nr:citramalate synthase [Maioricimonas rarisocia]QDU36774.1 2-isopropylmalate synthase [Maioricimonas rarisocia]
MAMHIQLYDTTLRDGSQGEGVNFSVQDKLLITKMLDDLGFDFIEGGFAGSNEKDTEYFSRVQELDLKHAQICAFGMTRRRGVGPEEDAGLQAMLSTGTTCCTVVGKTWDLHVTEVLRVDLEENVAMIRDSVGFLKSQGRRVLYDAEHFFDGYKANPEYALETVLAAQDAGAEIIVCCDTNGGTLPDELAEIVTNVQKSVSIPLGIHCHNDCDVAVANSLRAVDAGAVQVQGTINGIGERCGNADLVSVAANLAIKKGQDVLQGGEGVKHLTELSRYVYELSNMNFRSNQPFVGRSAFAHKGGMHVHAVNRLASSYEHIDPELVGNERRVLVSELSGRSNIVAKTTKFRIDHDQELMKKILDRVVELENEGWQFEASEASFDLLVKKIAGTYEPKFRQIHYRVSVETAGQKEPLTEATVKLQIDGDGPIRHEVAEGDGPVNALDNALRKALIPTYGNLAGMHLVDYKVRVINSSEGTAARVRVVIESADEHDVWSTVGVSENVIEASWLALVDAIEFKLYKDEGEVGAPLEEAAASPE